MSLFFRVAIIILFPTIIFAQPTDNFKGNRPDSLHRNAPKIGKVFGSIRDIENNQPIGFATIAFLSAHDSSIVGGVQTNEKGNFLAMIHQLPDAQFYGFLHYETEEIDFRQNKIKADTLAIAQQKVESIFDQLKDISEMSKILNNSSNNTDIPNQLLSLFTEFSIHGS